MRFMVTLKPLLSEDSDQLIRDLDLNQIIDDTLVTTWDGGIVTVAQSVANQAVVFPKVAAGKYLLIIVWSGEITYRVNLNTSSPLGLKPNPATTPDPILPYQKNPQPGIVFMGPMTVIAPLTALFFSNPSSTTPARVQVAIIGEAT